MHGLRYAAAFSLLVARVVSAANVTMHGWYNCSQYSLIEEVPRNADPTKAPPAQCATFKVPLCYEGICKDPSGREIDIFVKRYVNGKPEGKANVIFMQGGPGAASPAMESAMTELNRLLGDRVNVYTLDHRGTGRSNKLDCVASQATTSGSPGGMGLDAKEFEGCARELENKYGSDLSSFSVTSAASDLKFFIANFLQGETTYVYGVSYGTLLVERLMHLNPPGVAGYILDGIATTSGASSGKGMYMSKWDLGMDEVARYFLSYCEKNRETCGKYFGSSGVAGALSDLLRSLTYGSHTCSYFLSTQLAKALQLPRSSSSSAGVYLRAIFGSLLQNYSLRNVIPAIVYRVARCDYEDQKVLERFFSTLGKQLQVKSEEDQLMSQLLYGLIVYSELWESPPVTDEIAAERFLNALMGSGVSAGQYCAYTKDSTSQACRTYKYTVGSYDASPITYKKDKYYNVAAKPPANVSVLLLSGKMDPQTPHKYAEYLYEALDTTKKALITFEYATHGALWRTPVVDSSTNTTCGMSILASYIENSGKLEAVDKSCVANEKPLDFALPASILSEWLNTSSPFEGKLMEGESSSSSSSSPFKAGFVVLTLLFVAALMIAIIFGVLWVRARRARAAAPAKEQGVYEASTV